MAIPKPKPQDWLTASAAELRLGDQETLKLLQESYKNVNRILKDLPSTAGSALGSLVYRAQLERTRRELLAEQARLFDRLGDKVSARRLRAATRAAKLSRAADNALLSLAGAGEEGKRLYDGATITAQRTLETILTRAGISAVPLAERIYNTNAWMNGRLDRLIAKTLAAGLNAQRFAKVARDWFNPSVPGGTRYAAMRLARTEINNAFHATSISYARDKPWVSQMEWSLSRSHPVPDKCNEYADLSPWDVTAIPRKPHPQCLCYVTEVTPDEDEWMDRFIAGEFDDYLDGELAKENEKLGIKQPTDDPVKVTSSAPSVSRAPEAADKPQPVSKELTGQAAHDAIPKGLFKRGSLDPKQRKAAKTWESGWFAVINGFLRNDRWGEKDYREEEALVNTLDTAYAESLLPDDIQTWRGVNLADRIFGDSLGKDLTGFAWQEKGYASTTSREHIADLFLVKPEESDSRFAGKNVKMTVRAEKGLGALEISTDTKGSGANGPQAEITLQRNTKWTVEKDNGVDANGIRHIEVRVSRVRPEDDATRKDQDAAGGSAGAGASPAGESGTDSQDAALAPAGPQKDGYLAGQWRKSGFDDEVDRFAAMLEAGAPPEKRAIQEEKLGPDWARISARNLLGGSGGDDGVTYSNGNHRVQFTGTLTPEQQLEFLSNVDYLQTNFPTGWDMHITVGRSTEFGFNVGGETTIGTGSMHINEAVMQRETWPGMPASANVSSAQYVLAHEWGHSADRIADTETDAYKHVHQHAIQAGGMTSYGRHGIDGLLAPREGYAEAFAEWTLTKGKTTNPAAIAYAKHFHWGDRFGTHR